MSSLYVITDDSPFEALLPKIKVCIDSGVGSLQYRRKSLPVDAQQRELDIIVPLLAGYSTNFIINDQLGWAVHYGTGVHLGQGDGCVVSARQVLAANSVIGVTCHASLDLARQAMSDGASYVAFGAVYPSTTKPQAQRVDLAVLQRAVELYGSEHVCAIGGLQLDNTAAVLATGVGHIAVVNAVFGAGSIEQLQHRLELWQKCLKKQHID